MKNKIGTIELMQRKNTGNYEHMETTVSIVVSEDSNEVEAGIELKKFVHDFLYDKGDFSPNKLAVEKSSEGVYSPKEVVVESKKAEAAVEKPVEKAEEKKAVEKAEPKKKVAEKSEPKKAKAGKNTVYDRTLDLHKSRLREFMDDNLPEWSDGASLPKFIAASKNMVGEDFLDENGELLSSFTDKFLAAGK